jgi:hypothetical protein
LGFVLVFGPLIGALIYSAVSRSLQMFCGEVANGLPAATNGRSIGSIAATAERGSSNGKADGSQSSQPQAQAADQEKAAPGSQAEKQASAGALTPERRR